MTKYQINDWNMFENLIKSSKIESYYDEMISYIIKKRGKEITLPKGSVYYRSRCIDINDMNGRGKDYQDGFYGFDKKNSLAPKAELVDKGGRVNRKGQSVLYIAEDSYTAIAEVRPDRRQNISVAEIELLQDIKVVEFKLKDTCRQNGIEEIYREIAFKFYLPVNENKEDYLVTQYIGEKLYELGYGGVKYSSSLSENEMNIAIFEPELKAKANNSKLYNIHSVLYYAEEQLPRNNDEKLIPESIKGKFSEKEIACFFNRMK